MNSVTLDELKNLEKSIKKEVIVDYNNYIPKEKVDYWLVNEYFNKSNYSNNKSLSKYQGELLRHLFSELINIDKTNNIESKNLKEGFVEYYVDKFSKDKKIEINERPDLKNKLKNANEIAQRLGKDLNKLVFLGTFDDIHNALNEGNISLNSSIPSLTLIYDNNEQFIKYIDDNNETHLVKSENPKKVSKLYKKLSSSNTDLNDMFKQLTNINETINNENKEIKSEEINMLDFIKKEENETEKIEINEEVIDNVIADITNNEIEEIESNNDIENNDNVKINSNDIIENNNVDSDIDYDLYEKKLEEGILEPIIEENYETANDLKNDEVEYKNDESYDFDKTGYIELIKDENSIDNEEKDEIVISNDNSSINEQIPNEESTIENLEDSTVGLDVTSATEMDDIKEETPIENNLQKLSELEKEKKKDDMYMIFYIFAITVSLALIIGMIILKYYS